MLLGGSRGCHIPKRRACHGYIRNWQPLQRPLLSSPGASRPMSNAKQILSMLRSRAEGDEDQFLAIALQVAAGEARQGRRTSAEEIRAAVEALRKTRGDRAAVHVELSRPRGDLEGLLELRKPDLRLSEVVLSERLRSRLDRIVLQQERRTWLREGNRTPSRKLLFAGPPGSGKTMTAEAVAGELRLPFFVVRMDALITRYMGETSAKLRLVFYETIRRRGVYLFDEFDAVGGRRTATNERRRNETGSEQLSPVYGGTGVDRQPNSRCDKPFLACWTQLFSAVLTRSFNSRCPQKKRCAK